MRLSQWCTLDIMQKLDHETFMSQIFNAVIICDVEILTLLTFTVSFIISPIFTSKQNTSYRKESK